MDLSVRQTYILNGILFGKASIIQSKNRPYPFVRERSEKKEYIDWLVEEFDGGIDASRHEPEGKYRFQTTTDEDLESWRQRWYKNKEKTLPSKFTLTPETASLWWARRGTWDVETEFALIDMTSLDRSSKVGAEILEEAGFDARARHDNIELQGQTALDFLEWLNITVPGYEHKFDVETS